MLWCISTTDEYSKYGKCYLSSVVLRSMSLSSPCWIDREDKDFNSKILIFDSYKEAYRFIHNNSSFFRYKLCNIEFYRYKVVTLCGSTKFKDDFMRVQKELTLKGCIIISVGLFGHSGDEEVWEEGVKEMLDDMHKKKIDMADEIYVINKDGYIGESTKSEIEYAKSKGKSIKYMESI